MSEVKLISPMLDGFAMGDPISDHNGVRCCPAIRNATGDRYIVKIISIPASQTQLDALLLTGAYPDAESALAYFKTLAEETTEEVKTLQKLSETEGFLPFEDMQVVPMEDQTGYDIYLLRPYERTLSKHFVRSPMTHLSAINLGLDLCNALAASRRSGYLCVDLKPNNVYVTPEQGYRIGDIGFVRLDSLKYASLPDKYRSDYTAPEVADAFASLNDRIDIYALGLILYQAYNNGDLPVPNQDTFTPPMYADYEMSEIIMKACASDPENRWQDPVEMGQALVSYMQRNGANDTPIIPPAPVVAEVEASVAQEEAPAEAIDGANAEVPVMAVAEEAVADNAPADGAYADLSDETSEILSQVDALTSEPIAEPVVEEQIVADPEQSEAAPEMTETEEEVSEPSLQPEVIPVEEAVSEVVEIAAVVSAEEVTCDETPTEELQEDLTETAPAEEPEDVSAEEPAEELDADAEEVEDENEEDTVAAVIIDEESEEEGEDEEHEDEPQERKSRKWVQILIPILLLIAILCGAMYYYTHYYLQPVESVVVSGSEDKLIVFVNSTIDESKLTVICSDAFGNKITAPVSGGKAEFSNLMPDTGYNISVQIQGFHKLTGQYSASYSTPVQTEVTMFNAVTGHEDGSVILTFEIEGQTAENWTIQYSAEGEAARNITVSDKKATINDLTVGKNYTFRLSTNSDIYLTGITQITYTASDRVFAEDVWVSSCANNSLVVNWNAPEDQVVDSWIVHCTNNDDYNQTITTEKTTATFTDLDHLDSFSIVVKASGMTDALSPITIPENTVTVTNLKVDSVDTTSLKLSWDTSLEIPDIGWTLEYKIEGTDIINTMNCLENSVEISPVYPGCNYSIVLIDQNNNPMLNGEIACAIPNAADFEGTFSDITFTRWNFDFTMCKTPAKSNWNHKDVKPADRTTTFSVGQKASFDVHLTEFYKSNDHSDVTVTYVVWDSNGNPYSIAVQNHVWSKFWSRQQYYIPLDIPNMPTVAGEYKMTVYFNGMIMAEKDFTITA